MKAPQQSTQNIRPLSSGLSPGLSGPVGIQGVVPAVKGGRFIPRLHGGLWHGR